MASTLASILIRSLLLGIGEKFGPDKVDLLQGEVKDAISKKTLDNICIFQMLGAPVGDDGEFINTSFWLKCGDDTTFLQAINNPEADTDIKLHDDRVGSITVNFQGDRPSSQYPFPGAPIVYNDDWHDSAFEDGIGWNNCVDASKKGSIVGKDCDGKKIIAKVCIDGFGDGEFGTINRKNLQKHGWRYLMAMPSGNTNPTCQEDKKKRDTISRFHIAED